MLIATARLTGATLVTCDARVLAYAAHGHVAVIDARR
jgi:predicted nucleic acid-binding protein